MKGSFQRLLSAGILAFWGVMLTYFWSSGRLASYLHPSFQVWTAVSGVILLVLAGALWFLPPAEESHCHSDCGHLHDEPQMSRRIVATLVLVLPMLAAAKISPDQFGPATVSNRGFIEKINDLPGYQPAVDLSSSDKAGSETEAGAKPSLPRNEAGQIAIQTIDLLYAAEDPAMRADFENNEVELIGQYMPARAHNSEGDRFNLVRMFVVCCAADARPVAVTVQTAKKDSIAEMSWVKVTGKATFPVEGGQRIPMVVAKEVALCDPPEETFIY
jgi:uncharacterized repeat protein (TIGR03943 family)